MIKTDIITTTTTVRHTAIVVVALAPEDEALDGSNSPAAAAAASEPPASSSGLCFLGGTVLESGGGSVMSLEADSPSQGRPGGRLAGVGLGLWTIGGRLLPVGKAAVITSGGKVGVAVATESTGRLGVGPRGNVPAWAEPGWAGST